MPVAGLLRLDPRRRPAHRLVELFVRCLSAHIGVGRKNRLAAFTNADRRILMSGRSARATGATVTTDERPRPSDRANVHCRCMACLPQSSSRHASERFGDDELEDLSVLVLRGIHVDTVARTHNMLISNALTKCRPHFHRRHSFGLRGGLGRRWIARTPTDHRQDTCPCQRDCQGLRQRRLTDNPRYGHRGRRLGF